MFNEMILSSPISLAIIAGLANGAFLAPVGKNTINTNQIWLIYGFITYLLLPCLSLAYLIINNLCPLGFYTCLIILADGIFYGLGIYFLTKSIKLIGIGLPLAFNIAIGIFSGSFFSILIAGKLNSFFNYYYLLAYIIIFIAIGLYGIALSYRDSGHFTKWKAGFAYALIGSILCAVQGACLSFYSDSLKNLGNDFFAQLLPWSLIFLGCSLVFIPFQFIECKINPKVSGSSTLNILFAVIIMATLQIAAIMIYTVANINTGQYSQIYLWAVFMVCIVLSSTVCSYVKKEWANSKLIANGFNICAIMLLVSSVFILAHAS